MHLLCNLSRILFNDLHVLLRDVLGRNDTSGVSGVNACKLNVLHYGRNKGMRSVADGICLTLCCMVEESVDQDRSVGCYANGCIHIAREVHVVIYDLHAAAAKYVGRTNHNGEANLMGNLQCLFHGRSHARLRHRDLQLIHHCTEQVSVLSEVNHGG